MNKYIISVAHWVEGSGWSYTQEYEKGETSFADWSEDEFSEWITRDFNTDSLNDMIEKSNEEDDKWTYTIFDAEGNELYSISVWASAAAHKALFA